MITRHSATLFNLRSWSLIPDFTPKIGKLSSNDHCSFDFKCILVKFSSFLKRSVKKTTTKKNPLPSKKHTTQPPKTTVEKEVSVFAYVNRSLGGEHSHPSP